MEIADTGSVAGRVSRVAFDFTAPPLVEISVNMDDTLFLVPPSVMGRVQAADWVNLAYTQEPSGRYIATSLIVNKKEILLFSARDLDTVTEALNLRKLYEMVPVSEAQSVLSSIKDIGKELMSYLGKNPEKMREMHPDAFEKLVAELLASMGFQVEWIGRNRATSGDVIAFKKDASSGLSHNYLVECKRYAENRPVKLAVAYALFGAKEVGHYSNAILATTSYFQAGIRKFALSRWDFELRDFKGLLEWLNRYRPREDGRLYMEENKLRVVRPRHRRSK